MTEIPIIDWQQAIKHAGNNKELAIDILECLLKNLKKEIEHIHQHFQCNEYIDLYKQIHKLHGAICYCGLPRLKSLMEKLETDLKNNIIDNLSSHLNQLNYEVDLLFKHYQTSSNLN